MKTILITGGTDGIGKAAALQLAQPGDNVTIVGRNPRKGEQAAAEIRQETGAQVHFVSVDMSLVGEIERFVSDYLAAHPRLDVLVHSAGVMMSERLLTQEGFEMTFATQYLSRYLLTERLLSALLAAGGGQVLFVSSGRTGDGSLKYDNLNGEKRYGAISALLTSSQALSIYTLALMRQHPALHIYNYGPGLVQTSLGRNMPAAMNLYVSTIGQLFSISSERVGTEIKMLLSGTHPSGFYLRGVKNNMPRNGLPGADIQIRLLDTSERLIQTARSEQAA